MSSSKMEIRARYEALRNVWYDLPAESVALYTPSIRLYLERSILLRCESLGAMADSLYKEIMNQSKVYSGELTHPIASTTVCQLYLDIIQTMIVFAYAVPMQNLMGKKGPEGDFCRLISRKIFSGLERVQEYLSRTRIPFA